MQHVCAKSSSSKLRVAFSAAALCVAGALCTSVATAADSSVTIVHAGTLLTVPGKPPVKNHSVIIKGARIEAVREGFVTAEQLGATTASVVDLRDRFVMPGMIDAHVHLTLTPGVEHDLAHVGSADLAVDAAGNARRTLMAGFTTVRDLGAASSESIIAVRDGIRRGVIAGPRIFAAGAAISATAGHGDVRGLTEEIAQATLSSGVCDGVDDCRRAVRAQYKSGAEVIKVHVTGGGGDPNGGPDAQPEIFDDELRAIVETAHRLGLRVAAHAHGTAGINSALRAGVDSVEHSSWLDEDSVALYVKSGASMVPTLYLLDYLASQTSNDIVRGRVQRFGEQIMTRMKRAHAQGVRIVMGSDAGIGPHGDNARELAQYVKLGMSTAEAIVAATVNAAALLGAQNELGTLESEKWADMIATNDSPLADITALSRPTFVMREGVVYKNE